MSNFILYVLYSGGEQIKVLRVLHASAGCTKVTSMHVGVLGKRLEAHSLGNLCRREVNSEVTR
jgi:hypothetical protein